MTKSGSDVSIFTDVKISHAACFFNKSVLENSHFTRNKMRTHDSVISIYPILHSFLLFSPHSKPGLQRRSPTAIEHSQKVSNNHCVMTPTSAVPLMRGLYLGRSLLVFLLTISFLRRLHYQKHSKKSFHICLVFYRQ